MKERMKKLLFVTDQEGKQALSYLRAALTVVSTALVGVLISWFIWVTTQAYDVATNKTLIKDTAARLEKNIKSNADDIVMNQMEVEAEFDKVNGILHMRITKVDDKYDGKMAELHRLLMQTNQLVVEILIQKNKEVEIEKKQLDIQQKQAP
jgi:hypothetical protein